MAILIIGGSRGIGRAIGLGLAGAGDHLIINHFGDTTGAEQTVADGEVHGVKVTVIDGDISTPAGAREVLEQVAAETDRIDVLVHCAVKTVSGPILEADPDAFGSAVQVNAMSLLYVVQSALPLLGSGSSIIFLSSRGSRMALKNYASVGAPKAFAEAMIRYLAVELAPRGTRINALSPTAQDTEAFRSVFPDDFEERLAAAARNSPSGRAVGLDDIVDSARFLASPGAAMVQGQVLILDGAAGLVG